MPELIYNTATKACSYNGKVIDHCDNNYNWEVTQLHVVLAKVSNNTGIPIEDIQIKIINKRNDLYPEDEIRRMAEYWKESYPQDKYSFSI